MIKQNYLEKLLDGAKVEWLQLGKVCNFKNGFAFKSNLFKENGFPIIRIKNIDGKTIDLSDVKYFNPNDYKENTTPYEINNGDILVAMSGATTGKIGFYSHKNTAYLNQRVGKFLPKKETLNNRYLYHYLLSKIEKIYMLAGGGAQPNLSSISLMEKIKIPIPSPDNLERSLFIQGEIVGILDRFTELTAELTAELTTELTTRQKQYHYYRDKLLTFDDNSVEWKPLGEITTIKTGQSVNKNMISNNPGKYPVINSGRDPLGFIGQWNTDNNPIGITTRGAGVGSITWQEGKYFRGNLNYAVNIKSNSSLDVRYLYHLLLLLQPEIQSLCTFDGIPALNARKLDTLKIPIPSPDNLERSLFIQGEIAGILDKFEALAHSISEGLPREIELRQKQYEYYRNLLLNFPKPKK